MITNLLTEDNLPSYHREIAENFSRDGAWGTWVGRWTAEEIRHSTIKRDYLVVTRGVDPVALERDRMAHMGHGFAAPAEIHGAGGGFLHRVGLDENLHMIFYRKMCAAALDLAPDQAMAAIDEVVEHFRMPGYEMPNFRRHGVLMAIYGIYDLRQHLEDVLMPVVRKWNLLDRDDFGPPGQQARDRLAAFLRELETVHVPRFEEHRDRARARDAAKHQASVD